MKKIIAYSLYNDHEYYLFGMLENILLAQKIFSDWIIRIYYNDTVPPKWINTYKSFDHVELIFMDEHHGHLNAIWRLLSLYDNTIDIMISRDCDSPLTVEDLNQVNNFIESDKTFLVQLYFRNPLFKIFMGGFGYKIKSNLLDDTHSDYIEFTNSEKIKNETHYTKDQIFMNNFIYDKIKNDCLVYAGSKKVRGGYLNIYNNMIINDSKISIFDDFHMASKYLNLDSIKRISKNKKLRIVK